MGGKLDEPLLKFFSNPPTRCTRGRRVASSSCQLLLVIACLLCSASQPESFLSFARLTASRTSACELSFLLRVCSSVERCVHRMFQRLFPPTPQPTIDGEGWAMDSTCLKRLHGLLREYTPDAIWTDNRPRSPSVLHPLVDDTGSIIP